ncbi:unnamed protein product, partial [Meganyctiphanes norvegica]
MHSLLPLAICSAARKNVFLHSSFILILRLQFSTLKIRSNTWQQGCRKVTHKTSFLQFFLTVYVLAANYGLFCVMPFSCTCTDILIQKKRKHSYLLKYTRIIFIHKPYIAEQYWCSSLLLVVLLQLPNLDMKLWVVGLLRYYEVRQVPNFLLALPVVMLVICHCALYLVDNPSICWGLGIPPNVEKHNKKKDENSIIRWNDRGISSWRVFVYTAQSLVLCLFCALCIHVQVTTRLLCSSCPVVYWFAAHLMKDPASAGDHSSDTTKSKPIPAAKVESLSNLRKLFNVAIITEFPKNFWGQVIISYFMLYFFVGIVLFSNFLPWT